MGSWDIEALNMYKTIKIKDIPIDLLASRAAYFPSYKILAISDWHLNKLEDNNNYKEVDADLEGDEFLMMGEILEKYKPQQVVLLGLTFHKDWEANWKNLYDFVHKYSEVEFICTQDLLGVQVNTGFGVLDNLKFFEKYILDDKLCFSHGDAVPFDNKHVHVRGGYFPGCILSGKGGQVYRMPCFKRDGNILKIPSYGRWTGLQILEGKKGTRMYGILGEHIVTIKS